MKIIFLALGITFLSACLSCAIRTQSSSTSTSPDSVTMPTPTPKIDAAVAASPESPIRSFDFQNFTYPWTKDLGDVKKTFTLTNGKLPETRTPEGRVDGMGVYWSGVKYGDVTGDGREEAIVSMSILTGGSTMPHMVYVYSAEMNRPQLLWHFSTGDRADGGLRNAYGEQGQLVVELNSHVDAKGDCCPTRYNRTRYKWSGKRFEKTAEELLPVS